MTVAHALRDIALVLGAALVAVPLAALLRVPLMVVLVGAGALVGPPVLDVVDVPLSGAGAQLVFTLGVSLILFHGGVGISLRVISRTAVGLALLVLPGVILTALVVAVPIRLLLDVPWSVALMIGAVLSPTDPAILVPLFDRLRLRPKVAQTLIAESAFNDPTGTVLTLALASVVTADSVELVAPAADFAQSLVLGALIGMGGGAALAVLLSTRRGGVWRDSRRRRSWPRSTSPASRSAPPATWRPSSWASSSATPACSASRPSAASSACWRPSRRRPRRSPCWRCSSRWA